MGFRLGQSDDGLDEVHEINVTPFIDVMLVLLIIFMVAAPLSTVDVPVDLPAISATPQQRPDKPLFLTVKADLSLAVGDAQTTRNDLVSALNTATGGDKSTRLFLRADRTVPYGELMAVMDVLKSSGFLKVALVALESGEAR
jgi:biopolymer transport protein ExbD